jgi:glycosyltransferase involved in cell wall biosynthesis
MAMRILHILNDITDRGNGIVNTAVDLAIEQARQGQSVAVVSGGGGYESILKSAGVVHLTLDQSRSPLQLLRAVFRLRSILVLFHPEVVHVHMRTGLLLAWFWRRFGSFTLVGHVHNVHDRESVMMGLADKVVVVSQSVAASMRAQGIPARKIRVVLNRTLGSSRQPDLESIQPAPLARPSIVTVAGMTARKGIEELIAAFAIAGRDFPGAHLYIVGDGPERSRFEEQARRSPHRARIHFEGFQAQPQAYMLAADVFVLASRRESFGLVLIEARQAGCAIVATDVDGIAEALDDGRAGLLVPPQDVDALAGAVCRMLESSQERRIWQGLARVGIENYSVDVMAREVEALYRERKAGWVWPRTGKVIWTK